jgi:hypothetical protein
LHQWQAEALRTGGAMDGGSLVFTAPTSGGKTLVAEILLVRSYLRTGKKAIMVLPYVSIVTEKSAWLKKVLAPSGYRVEAFHGIQGGDIAKADLAICTMEKANALVNRMAKENQVSCLPTAPAWLPAGQVRRRRAVAHSLTHSLTDSRICSLSCHGIDTVRAAGLGYTVARHHRIRWVRWASSSWTRCTCWGTSRAATCWSC